LAQRLRNRSLRFLADVSRVELGTMRFASKAGTVAGALLTAGLAHGPALAQGAACQSLQQQYVAALRGSAPVGGTANDAAALSRSLAAAQQSANVNHCSSFGIFSPPPSPACPAIRGEIDRLQSSLRQAGGGGGFSGFGGGFFGYASYAPSPTERLRDALSISGCEIPDPSAGGGNRTLCVRTCDGYYFPISASGGGGYGTDAQVCQTTYGPATATELFVGSLGGDMADARSLNGQRYGDKPYAFLYRTKFNPVCVAQLQNGVHALANDPSALLVAPASPSATVVIAALVAVPQLRPRMSEDPETLANAGGNLRPRPVEQPAVARAAGAGPRIVGAGYYNLMLEQQPRALPVPASLVTSPPPVGR
jgi:hypothetical protein